MDTHVDFQPMYPHHDLLIEVGQIEMAIADLPGDSQAQQLALEDRLQSLLEALDHLAV